MAKPTVGLVFRPDAIEAAVLTRGLRGVTLQRCARVNIATQKDSSEYAEQHDQQVAQAVQEALSACQVATREVAVTVPAKDVLLRCFKLPMLPKPEWEQAVHFEVRKYIPFKVDELTWTYHLVEHKAEKRLTAVFLGIRTESLVKIQHFLETAGINARGIEPLSVSLARAAGRSARKLGKDGFVGVVDLEHDVAHIIIMKDQLPYLSRDVSLAQTREVVGVGPQPADMDRRAELLLSELRLSLEYFTHEHAYAIIEKILLYGEEFAVGSWCPWLTEQLHCPVELGGLAVQVPSGSPAAPLQFASAVGLAMNAMSPGPLRLDFLLHGKSGGNRQKFSAPGNVLTEFFRGMTKPAAIQAGLAAVALAVLAFTQHQQVATVQSQLDQVVSAHMQLGGDALQNRPQEDLTKLSERVKLRVAFLRSGILDRVSVAQKLDALAKSVPDGVWLEALNYTNRFQNLESWQPMLTMRGACLLSDADQELEVISGFAQKIKDDPMFFRGFSASQLGEILATEDPTRKYSYRTFRLSCQNQSRIY